jgi:hypothetical protein
MRRWFVVWVLVLLAPAFAADAPEPAAKDRSGPSEEPERYVLISVEDVAKLAELIQRMTAALRAQSEEIERLRALPGNLSCT